MEATSERIFLRKRPVATAARVRRLGWQRWLFDWLAQRLFGLAVLGICLLLVAIAVILTLRSWPLLSTFGVGALLTGQQWQPMQGHFGFATFIVGSITVTTVAMAVAVVPAILSGIYLADYVSSRTRNRLKPVLDLLVGIPSVIYGLWGVLLIVPLVRDYLGPWSAQTIGAWLPFFARTNPSGYGLLTAGVVLGVMVFPLIAAVTEEVMRSVPNELREALLALGATRWETTKCIVRHVGLPGIGAAIVLGFSRAFGETLAVMMTVGSVAQIPHSIFDAAYPLPALIANNYGEMMSVPLYESALMGAALILLVVVVIFNVGARLVVDRLTKGKRA